MRRLLAKLVAVALLTEVAAEAFFLPSFGSVLGNSVARHQRPPHPRAHRPHRRQPRRQNTFPVHKQHVAPPHYPSKAAAYPRPNLPPAPRPSDPGANVKLDYGGWTAIGFDDSLPGQAASSAAAAPQIVTLEAAIAAAPAAQSDDLVYAAAPAPVYESPAPAPPYQPALSTAPALRPSSGAAPAYRPAPANTYRAPTFGAAVPAVPYIPSTADVRHSSLDYNNPAVAPAYEAPAPAAREAPAPPPSYQSTITYQKTESPKYQKLTEAPKYKKTTTALKFEKPTKKKYTAPATVRPETVVLPAYTPAPPVYSDGFGGEQFPIVALITADSAVPEKEKYVSFSIGGAKNGGSPDSLPTPGEYQATADTTRLAKDVNGVYVQPATAGQDELYYIYYQDPELDPSYGVKIQSTREAKGFAEVPAVPEVRAAAPLADFPVYDYDEAREAADAWRVERSDPVYSRRARQEPAFSSRRRYGTDFSASTARRGLSSSSSSSSSRSSVSFTTSVGGKSSGFSYHL